jgi:hypothetical protein
VLHSRAHRVPDERVACLNVLWACPSPASLEERQYLYEDRAEDEAKGLEDKRNWGRFPDINLEENGIRTRERRGRKKGGTICNNKREPLESMDASAR